jgi:hypothetical protein
MSAFRSFTGITYFAAHRVARMTRLRGYLMLLVLLSAMLAVVALWLAQDNPNIDNTSRGDNYTCAAPYDTVLIGSDNIPGGEPPADSDDIATRCVAAGKARFAQSAAAGAGSIIFVAIAAGVAVRARRSTPASLANTPDNSHTAD